MKKRDEVSMHTDANASQKETVHVASSDWCVTCKMTQKVLISDLFFTLAIHLLS